MTEILNDAINKVKQSKAAFCRFITANDTGSTGGHQDGFYIPKFASSLLFEEPGVKGENKDKFVEVLWQNDFITESRFVYYGKKTRDEYRITRFGSDFPFFNDDNVGNLLIIAKEEEDNYSAFVLSSDQDIEDFFAYFDLSAENTNQLIDKSQSINCEDELEKTLYKIVSDYESFPDTLTMARLARDSYNQINHINDKAICSSPDVQLLRWIDSEYKLFKYFEEKVYGDTYKKAFDNCQSLIDFSNTILNRRKSRAGKSLEHHLANIFTKASLKFEEQVVTEDNKKPDFIFPDGESYHNLLFPKEKLVFLGAKTTCKDRWRQVLNEADRIDDKYLFTLQQGISKNQLKEMKDSRLILVVPQGYKKYFDEEYQPDIETLSTFITKVKMTQT